MKAALFYADILGFSVLAAQAGARRALEQLADVAHLLSAEHSLAKYLQSPVWRARYGLSDSLFLVGDDPTEACAAAAEFFFNLAFYNASQGAPVLMRGAITFGEVREVEPLFRETAGKNIVGEAVVRAAGLERSGAKGPRLLVAREVARSLRKSKLKTLLDATAEGVDELLWLLPPDVSTAQGLLIGDVAGAAARLALKTAHNHGTIEHYIAYLDLCLRSLMRLKTYYPEAAAAAIRKAALRERRAALDRVVAHSGDKFEVIREVLSRALE